MARSKWNEIHKAAFGLAASAVVVAVGLWVTRGVWHTNSREIVLGEYTFTLFESYEWNAAIDKTTYRLSRGDVVLTHGSFGRKERDLDEYHAVLRRHKKHRCDTIAIYQSEDRTGPVFLFIMSDTLGGCYPASDTNDVTERSYLELYKALVGDSESDRIEIFEFRLKTQEVKNGQPARPDEPRKP